MVTELRYFARNKLSKSLVHKENLSLIWQIVSKLGILSREEGQLFEFELTRRQTLIGL